MIDEMIRCFVNPACSRVMMALLERGEATAGQLQEALPGIPPASLYRYLGQLCKAGVIEVACERRVRGAVERVYRGRADMGEEGNRMLKENPGPTLLAMYAQFSMRIMEQFTAYCKRGEVDIERDGFSFSVCPVYATTEELRGALIQVGEVLTKLMGNQPEPGRKLHSIAVITTPPQEA